MTDPPPTGSADVHHISVGEVGAVLIGAALGSLLYRVVVEVMLKLDAVHEEPTYDDAGFRDAVLRIGPWAALVAGGVLLWWAVRRHGDRPPRRVIAGAALLGAGIALFAWGALDMHGLGLYDWRPGAPAGVLDVVYHGTGVLVAVVGYALLTAPRESARHR